jgi:hypothetical protein
MMRKIAIGTLMVATSLLAAGLASAVSIGFAPGDSTVLLGDTVSVDIVVSDLAGEIVSAYDLDVTYDSTLVTAAGVSFANSLGDPLVPEVFQDSDISVSGLVDLAEVSLLSDASLLALQGGDAVTLATLEFDATAIGALDLAFVFDAFNGVHGTGARPLDPEVVGGSVNVIPEPTAALVFALGAAAVAASVRRRRA